MANEEEIGNLPTRALVHYVERYKPAFTDKVTRARGLITTLNDESSFIRVERAMEETKKAEVMAEELIYYSRHISGRRNWTVDDIGETDILVTETMNITAIANIASFTTEVRELVDFSEIQFRAQKEASELKTAKAEERIRREAREAEARGVIPAAREPTKPVQSKAADVPKPSILTFDCTWKTWDEEKKKFIHFYSQAYKPVRLLPAEQQGIFLSFLDNTLPEELNVKFIENPDAD